MSRYLFSYACACLLALLHGECNSLVWATQIAGPGAANQTAPEAHTQKLREAQQLFDQQRWADARAAYDQLSGTSTLERQLIAQRLITCACRLSNWEDALSLAENYAKSERLSLREYKYWPERPAERDSYLRDLAIADCTRELYLIIFREGQQANKPAVQNRAAQQVIAVDFRLLSMLDPDSVVREEKWGWDTDYPDVAWWWEEVRPHIESFTSADEHVYRAWRDGIPVDVQGHRIRPAKPQVYPVAVQRATRILYLLDEIQRLDASESRSDTARALWHLAGLMRRLYGPSADPAWGQGMFYYQFAQRPSFASRPADQGLTELWELDDDEARVLINGTLEVIQLDAAESPMALWHRIEQSYPGTDHAAEAIYARSLYYQNRRQFSKAIAEYKRLVELFPNHRRALLARKQLESIHSASVLLGATAAYPAGRTSKLWYAYRNTPTIEFVARTLDLQAYIRDCEKSGQWWEMANLEGNFFGVFSDDDQKRAKYIGEEVARWSQAAPATDQMATHSTELPLTKAGAYVVEARVPGTEQVSRGLVILTGAAIIQRSLPGQVLLWAVDTLSGRPLADQQVHLVHEKKRRQWKTLTTDQNGAIYLQAKERESVFALLTTKAGDLAFAELIEPGESDATEAETVGVAVTDRPLYRPGSTVNFRVWLRKRVDSSYRPAEAGIKVRVQIDGPTEGGPIRTMDLQTDSNGSANGTVSLSHESPLGVYQISMETTAPGFSPTVGNFRVEEYKKPEYSVTVTPASDSPQLGESLKVSIQANYYSGQPVAGAEVQYRVTRRRHTALYRMPTRWDWLYGSGYGSYSYVYPWLGDSIMSQEEDQWAQSFSWYGESTSPEYFVNQAVVKLDEHGRAEIRIETDKFSKAVDHELLIKADVRDASRRTIRGEGSVVVTRQQYHAFVQLDRGWYPPGSRATLDVNTRTANEIPVTVKGRVALYRVITSHVDTADQSPVHKELIETWTVDTDATGHARLDFQLASEGQYRIEYSSQGQRHQPITTQATFWVYGPKFRGAEYKLGGLEITPDKSSYAVGETARLLLHTACPNARLLIADTLEQHRFIDIQQHSQVIEIPITARHVPNFFFEATLMYAGQLFTESCEVFVPPVADLLTIQMQTDQAIYKPGDKTVVHVRVRDANDQPVTGSLTISGFDKALTAIAADNGPGPRALLTHCRNTYWPERIEQTLQPRRFEASGTCICPEFHLEDASRPLSGGMGGSPPTGGDPADTAGSQPSSSRATVRLATVPTDVLLQQAAADKWIEPKVRRDFSDSAVWLPDLQLNAQGEAHANLSFPESLTTWRIRGAMVTADTRVGEAIYEVKTSQDLIVRLQTPRFSVEEDQVVLSAKVDNYLAVEKEVAVELTLSAQLFQPLAEEAKSLMPDAQGNLHLIQRGTVASGKSARFDWPVRVVSSGMATITVHARTDAASDAMQVAIPLHAHALMESHTQTAFIGRGQSGTEAIDFELPANIDPHSVQAELTLLPSAAYAAFDALPFLVDYPYGCVEQTMSRFYPTVLAAQALKKLGTDIESVTSQPWPRFPVRSDGFTRRTGLTSAELQRMTTVGLERLYRFQHADGGWGWWEHDQSSPFISAYVLLGLDTAAEAGIHVSKSSMDRARKYLADSLAKPLTADQAVESSSNQQAFLLYVLSIKRNDLEEDARARVSRQARSLYQHRGSLNSYSQALLALTLHHQQMPQEASSVLHELLAAVQHHPEQETAWVETSKQDWWRWFNSDIETNALVLRALVAIEPSHAAVPRLANGLVAKRQYANHWRSTRDSAMAVQALVETLMSEKQLATRALDIGVTLDGQLVQEVQLDSRQLLSSQRTIRIDPTKLKPGPHRLGIVRKQSGPLHYSLQVQYQRREARHQARAQGGLRLERRYYRCDAAAQPQSLLKDGDNISIGDTIQVELTIAADENYEFLAFEDAKPAGCEPIQLRSGYGSNDGLADNIELRDAKVIFFVSRLKKGEHKVRYCLRAEVPGTFSAMPAEGFAMYTPEIQARSDERQLIIRD